MSTTRKPGRPPEANRKDISLAALRLFERHGYEKVTMDQVARAAGVSRTTLFRLFPSKADLVWDGIDEVMGPLKARAEELTRAKAPLRVVVDELVLPGLAYLDDPRAAEVARRRLRLAGASLELLGYSKFAEIQSLFSSTIAAGLPSRGTPPTLVADMVVASAFASVLWWARHDTPLTAADALRAGLTALREAT